jgi:hypothetical protein
MDRDLIMLLSLIAPAVMIFNYIRNGHLGFENKTIKSPIKAIDDFMKREAIEALENALSTKKKPSSPKKKGK